MRSFYSIIHISPNVATGDSVAVGIVFFNGKTFQTYFSDQKRKIAQRLITNKETDFKSLFNTIAKKCESLNDELQANKLIYNSEKYINSSYFEYLSIYSNGLIQFSKPKLFISTNQENEFDKLVQMFFNETIEKEIRFDKESQTELLIQKQLIERVAEKVHTNYLFQPALYPYIHFNYELDCIGLNGALIGAKSFNFNQSEQTIDLKLSHYHSIILMLSSNHHKSIEENNFYLIAEEPSSATSAEHKIWESAVTNTLITVIDPENSFKVAQLIEEKKATKFLI